MSASPMSSSDETASSIAPISSAVSSAAGLRFQPTTCAPSRSRAARPIDPPISPTPSSAILIAVVPRQPPRGARATAAASPSSTSTVLSQSMQASVIDWP